MNKFNKDFTKSTNGKMDIHLNNKPEKQDVGQIPECPKNQKPSCGCTDIFNADHSKKEVNAR